MVSLVALSVTNQNQQRTLNSQRVLAFLRDSTVSITLSMAVIYIIVAIFAGSEYIEKEISNGTSGLVYALH